MVLIPFTREFMKLRRRYKSQYSDVAKADTFAFRDAFELKVPTFEGRKRKFKMNKKGFVVIYGIFMFIMALIVVAMMLSPVYYFIDIGVNSTLNATHGGLLSTMFYYIPVFIVFMLLLSLVALFSGRR